MRWIEPLIARALAANYPWLSRVQRLPGAGLSYVFVGYEYGPAANQDGFGQ